jgi:hypothetical protein
MSREKNTEKPQQKEKRNSLLGWLISREEPDQDYVPELKTQWAHLDLAGRIKFILGAIVGAFLFFGALYVVYLVLSAMVG